MVADAAFAFKENMTFELAHQRVPLSALILLAGLGGWMAFFMLDRFYYHALLVGAVAQGRAIEDSETKRIPQLQLSKAITAFSRVRFRGGQDSLRARDKLDIFYLFVGSMLAVAQVIILSGAHYAEHAARGTRC